jgi:hypothetical protein
MSHEFLGVDLEGMDKYLVRHAHGTEEIFLMLDANGTLVAARRQL